MNESHEKKAFQYGEVCKDAHYNNNNNNTIYKAQFQFSKSFSKQMNACIQFWTTIACDIISIK